MDEYRPFLNAGEYWTGNQSDVTAINPWMRTKKEDHEYDFRFEDVHRGMEFRYDEYERTKPFKEPRESYVDNWFAFPHVDSDDELEYSDNTGDWIYSDPPDECNGPPSDHKMDEELIWQHDINILNQDVIQNEWAFN